MGMAPSVVIYDELGQTEGRDLYDALDTAMGKRLEPLMIVISTQAARDEAPLSTLIDYGLRIQRNEITDPSFHLTLYTAPEDADPWNQATWKLANPALGDFRSLKDVQRLALQAQRMPAAEASFKNLILIHWMTKPLLREDSLDDQTAAATQVSETLLVRPARRHRENHPPVP
jgi:phage terminase large subunit-like protein